MPEKKEETKKKRPSPALAKKLRETAHQLKMEAKLQEKLNPKNPDAQIKRDHEC